MANTQQPVEALFAEFLDVCNKAMEAHKDEFPYTHIWNAAETLQGKDGMHVTVYDDEPKGDYNLRIKDKQIDVVQENEEGQSGGWRINTSYMKQVLANPENYIKDPTKLDWDWLKSRL